jgi:hypothetical protein
MTNNNVASRRKTRKSRLEAKSQELIGSQAAQVTVKATVNKIRELLADSAFRKKLTLEGVRTFPMPFAAETNPVVCDANYSQEKLSNTALEFAAAWAFLYPLLSNRVIVDHLQSNWPEFVIEFRDAFILLVLNGPFPQECCGTGRPSRKLFPSERVKILQAERNRLDVDK